MSGRLQVQLINVLAIVSIYLFLVRFFWCRFGYGVCGSCGLGKGCKDGGKCKGFIPLLPGVYQPYSKCRSVSVPQASINGADDEDDDILSIIQTMPDQEQKLYMHDFILYKKAKAEKDTAKMEKYRITTSEPNDADNANNAVEANAANTTNTEHVRTCAGQTRRPSFARSRPLLESFRSVRPTHTSQFNHRRV